MESDYEELAQGLFALAAEECDSNDFSLEDFQEVYEADGGAALALASTVLINCEVKLPLTCTSCTKSLESQATT